MDKLALNKYIKAFIIFAGTISFYFLLKYTILFFYPILIAFALAYLINPLVSWTELRLKLPRMAATIVIVLLIFSSLFSLIFFVISEFVQGTTYLAKVLPTHFQSLMKIIEMFIAEKIIPIYNQIYSLLQKLNDSQQTTINDYVHQLVNQITSFTTTVITDILLRIPLFISLLPQSMTLLFFIIIATILITNEWKSITKRLLQITPTWLLQISTNLISQFKKSGLGFLKAQTMLVCITSLIILIGLFLLDMEHALTITLLISFVDLLPIIGTGIVFIPWIIYHFLHANFALTIGLSIVYIVVIILRQFLEPKMLSIHIGISPLAALLTLFISVQWWGIIGIFIAPLLLVFVSSIYQSGLINKLWRYIQD